MEIMLASPAGHGLACRSMERQISWRGVGSVAEVQSLGVLQAFKQAVDSWYDPCMPAASTQQLGHAVTDDSDDMKVLVAPKRRPAGWRRDLTRTE